MSKATYTRCTIQWIDDDSISEDVVIKSNLEVVESEDDDIFFYGLSPEFLTWAMEQNIVVEEQWRVIAISSIGKKY